MSADQGQGERLPQPECELGYTKAQVGQIMGHRLDEFNRWMRGQTVAVCEGRLYNHDTQEYEGACGGIAHGVVTYEHDIRRFLAGLPVID